MEPSWNLRAALKPHHPYAVATLIIAIIANTPRHPRHSPLLLTRHPILLAMHERIMLMTRGALPLARKIMTDGGLQYIAVPCFICVSFPCVFGG